MADVTTYNQILNAVSNDQVFEVPFDGWQSTVPTTLGTAGLGTPCQTHASVTLPALSNSITKYRLLLASLGASAAASFLIVKATNLGSIDLSSGTFTDGATMPTRTQMGTASFQTNGPLLIEATTAITGTSPTITVTYTNQAGGSSTLTNLALARLVRRWSLRLPLT